MPEFLDRRKKAQNLEGLLPRLEGCAENPEFRTAATSVQSAPGF